MGKTDALAAPSSWICVLAGGEGTRLAPLTRALYGEDLPKQFATLAGDRSLLQETVERAGQLAPLSRVLVVVAAHQEARARAQLAAYPGVELVVQPKNLDTAPGMLLPLARIRSREPRAQVVFLPSDHHVVDDRPLLAAIRAALAGPARERITLLGVAPDRSEPDYGWILPVSRPGPAGVAAVRRFFEKPPARLAAELRARGALWNTFISNGPVAAFWHEARRRLPRHARVLERYARRLGRRDEASALAAAYAEMPAANFSRDVLELARELSVVPVAGTGWSDWGSPARVFESLAGTPALAALRARIQAVAAEPARAVG
jgi:mannose-1-phosphate guanylyltransferase